MNRKDSSAVIPAEAGIQVFQHLLDPGLRRGDGGGGTGLSLSQKCGAVHSLHETDTTM